MNYSPSIIISYIKPVKLPYLQTNSSKGPRTTPNSLKQKGIAKTLTPTILLARLTTEGHAVPSDIVYRWSDCREGERAMGDVLT